MAAAIVTLVDDTQHNGDLRSSGMDYVFSTSYATGGEAITPAQFGLQTIAFADASVKVAGTGSVTAVHYNVPTGKLLAYTAAAQVANTTDLSGVTIRIVAYGK